MRWRGVRNERAHATGSVAVWLLVLIAVVATAGSSTGAGAVSSRHRGVAVASAAGYDVSSFPHRLRELPTASAVPTPTPTAIAAAPTAPAQAKTLAQPRPQPRPSRPAPTPPPPPPVGGSSAAQAVLAAINSSRAAAGLPALQWSAGLSRSAHLHNLAMAAVNQLSHQCPGEASLGTRISAQAVAWSWAGENIGLTSSLTTSGAVSLEQTMVNETPPNDHHRQNILATTATMVGVDVIFDTAHNLLWLTEDFAN